MPRLNQQRQSELEPKRLKFAKQEIEKLGYKTEVVSETELQFQYLNKKVCFFPYSGWASGSTINNGRGLKKLLKQIKN